MDVFSFFRYGSRMLHTVVTDKIHTHTAPIPHSLLLLAYQDGFGPYLVDGFVQDKCVFVFNGRNTGFQEPR